MKHLLTAAVAALALTFGAASAQAQVTQSGAHVEVKAWDVFVDLQTGFAFVNTPVGWKFVRQLDQEQLARLPASTLVSMLPADEGDVRYAHPALSPSPRKQAASTETRMASINAAPAMQR